jgi:RNA polymerase sigma-70 factor, ECF subfamily
MEDTSLSLLRRLKSGDAVVGWPRFVALYTPLLMVWGKIAGVPAADVPDFVQDVFAHLWRKLPEFEYDPERGRFRAWLRSVTLNRWRELARRRRAMPAGGPALPDVPAPEAEAFWEHDYRAWLAGRATRVLQADFQPATWQAFWRVVVDEVPAARVAEELGLSVGAVHAARFRVLARLRQELAGLWE